jgi:transitional endoplasmic reticulum ATPase
MADDADTKQVIALFANVFKEMQAGKAYEKTDVDIERAGKKITLPAEPVPMQIDAAIETLQRKKKEEEQTYNAYEILDGFPFDAAVAFNRAMQRLYGYASPVDTPSFWGPQPPVFITVKTGPRDGDNMQIPWGSFKLPNVESPLTFRVHDDNGSPCLLVHGKVKRKDQYVILELVKLARKILKEESIYKGKAISFKVQEDGQLDTARPPEFMNLEGVQASDLVLNDDVGDQIRTNLFTPIEATEECRRLKIPLKRGVLLAGDYGTGKTLTARVTAKIAQDNGWTFVNLDNVRGLEHALRFASRYSPAVVFAEDIDRILEERDEAANDLINTIDGIVSKSAEVLTVLTTNHVERIAPVMLRPGRLDAIIPIDPPDERTAIKLVQAYAGISLPKNADLEQVGISLKGMIPATIREVVERSKLGMIGRRAQAIAAHDLVVAARGMTAHMELVNRKPNEPSPEHKLGAAFYELLSGKEHGFDHLAKEIEEIKDSMN